MNKKFVFKILFIIVSLISFLTLFLGNSLNYYLLIYNSDRVTQEDVKYINDYSKTLNKPVKIIDAKNISSGALMCQALKNSYGSISNNINGIQIFGTKDDVPVFDIGFEIDMNNGKIDEAYDDFVSDFFYSNFDSDMTKLNQKIGINSIFVNNLDISFQPKWPVARLPLKKGQFSVFIKKYFDYMEKIKLINNNIPVINFSNPILLEEYPPVDDMGYFIKNKIDYENGYLTSNQYRLYGLLEGYNKVVGSVSGGFERDNIEKENKNGIIDLLINCHGENDKFIKTIFNDNSYGNKKETSFMDRSNINDILKHNYYTLTAWSCLNAEGLNDQNIIYDILNCKCIDAIAATTIISNNGTDNRVSFEQSKRNNFYCFFYEFFKSRKEGYSRSQSFFNAQKQYASAIINHKNMDLFQYHVLNLLGYHYLGLL